jgi:hypothetical protein
MIGVLTKDDAKLVIVAASQAQKAANLKWGLSPRT